MSSMSMLLNALSALSLNSNTLTMRSFYKIASILTILVVNGPLAFSQSDLKLWYNKPAANWNEALPIGNGRIGAMIFGGVSEELIQLNEATLWSGGPANTNPNPSAPDFLPKVRKALE